MNVRGENGSALHLACTVRAEDGRTVFYLTEDRDIFISQADISKFQMAKAAIAAGIRILAEETGISLRALEKLRLGGGFGSFTHRRNSALLRMIPQECKGKTVKLGNTALAGAISAALSEEARTELLRIRDLVRMIDLPTHPSFSDAFTDAMFFELDQRDTGTDRTVLRSGRIQGWKTRSFAVLQGHVP